MFVYTLLFLQEGAVQVEIDILYGLFFLSFYYFVCVCLHVISAGRGNVSGNRYCMGFVVLVFFLKSSAMCVFSWSKCG